MSEKKNWKIDKLEKTNNEVGDYMIEEKLSYYFDRVNNEIIIKGSTLFNAFFIPLALEV